MPNTQTHTFTPILSGCDTLTREVEDALFEAGCDDAPLGSRLGESFLDFDREEGNLEEAILSAIRDVRAAGIGLDVERVECGDITRS